MFSTSGVQSIGRKKRKNLRNSISEVLCRLQFHGLLINTELSRRGTALYSQRHCIAACGGIIVIPTTGVKTAVLLVIECFLELFYPRPPSETARCQEFALLLGSDGSRTLFPYSLWNIFIRAHIVIIEAVTLSSHIFRPGVAVDINRWRS